jgi:hypothetical protein
MVGARDYIFRYLSRNLHFNAATCSENELEDTVGKCELGIRYTLFDWTIRMADPKDVEKPADEKAEGNGENDKTETPVKAEAETEATVPEEETNTNGEAANGENGTEDGDAAVADKVEATTKTTSKKGAKKGSKTPVKKEEPQSEVKEEGENAPDDKAQSEEIKNEEEPPKEKDAEMKEASTQKKGRKRKSEGITEGTSVAPGGSTAKRERRERKSVETFDPTDFKADRPVTVLPGRGMALGDLPRVRASIESAHSFDLTAAYKLIFARSKAALKKDMVDAVLSFSGYLPPLKQGASKAEQHEIDEGYEVRFDLSTIACLFFERMSLIFLLYF